MEGIVRMRILVVVVGLCIALPLGRSAAAQAVPETPPDVVSQSKAKETKPLPEVDALRLENLQAMFAKFQADMELARERMARASEQYQRYVQDLARRDGVEGWTLNLQERRWEKPSQPPGERK